MPSWRLNEPNAVGSCVPSAIWRGMTHATGLKCRLCLPTWVPQMRGDIYRLKASRLAQGHEQTGWRYCVLLQPGDLALSTVLVAPTSTSCLRLSFRPVIELDGVETMVMVDQTSAADVETRLGEWVGHLSLREMQAVDRALLTVLGLD